ncbi:MAG: BtrH N-terminal domain-containing protein, partial [Candidatus Promineifilaceae bacterium]
MIKEYSQASRDMMQTVHSVNQLAPFANSPALAGYHCWSNSIAKIYTHYGLPLTEELLFGLGAGLGFLYWEQKGAPPFVGGRDNMKRFVQDIGGRTGVGAWEQSTSSASKAQKVMLAHLEQQDPLMVRVDMGLLPYFDFPEEYHFGSHTIVICGYDGEERVLISDMDQAASGLKEGFYAPLTLDEIAAARGSRFKPFPPQNTYFEFDFASARPPSAEDILAAIRQNTEGMLHPPISNFGIKGIRRAAKEIARWPNSFGEEELRANLFMIYVMIEIGGTGGGIFRPMYARFLREAAGSMSQPVLNEAAALLDASGSKFSAMARLFESAYTQAPDSGAIARASALLVECAALEEEAFSL